MNTCENMDVLVWNRKLTQFLNSGTEQTLSLLICTLIRDFEGVSTVVLQTRILFLVSNLKKIWVCRTTILQPSKSFLRVQIKRLTESFSLLSSIFNRFFFNQKLEQIFYWLKKFNKCIIACAWPKGTSDISDRRFRHIAGRRENSCQSFFCPVSWQRKEGLFFQPSLHQLDKWELSQHSSRTVLARDLQKDKGLLSWRKSWKQYQVLFSSTPRFYRLFIQG